MLTSREQGFLRKLKRLRAAGRGGYSAAEQAQIRAVEADLAGEAPGFVARFMYGSLSEMPVLTRQRPEPEVRRETHAA